MINVKLYLLGSENWLYPHQDSKVSGFDFKTKLNTNAPTTIFFGEIFLHLQPDIFILGIW
jgi:hypothetical protein